MISSTDEPVSGKRYTYNDYLKWKNRKGTYSKLGFKDEELPPGFLGVYEAPNQYQLINGEAILFNEHPTEFYAISIQLFAELNELLKDKGSRAFSGMDVRLFPKDDNSDDTVVSPELVVISDRNMLSKGTQRAWNNPIMHNGESLILGPPDLVIEIFSPSVSENELSRLYDVYLKAKVNEYWLIDPEQELVKVYVFENGIFKELEYRSNETIVSKVLHGLTIQLKTLWDAYKYTKI